MIIRPALLPDATLIERINEATERARIIGVTGTLPIEVTLGTSEPTSVPHTA